MANLGHGGNIKEVKRKYNLPIENILDFSANINPIGVSENVTNAIKEGIEEIVRYPDITYFELKNSITEFENNMILKTGIKTIDDYKISNDDLILGNGAAEVLFNVVRGINPKEALIMAPTFSEYEEALDSVNCKVHIYELKEENDFSIQSDILDLIDEKLDVIFICNPNNPTGVITEKKMLKLILDKSLDNDVKVIIDESFLDFIDPEENLSMICETKEYPNLIIIKSLTKVFAIPGLRIGYGINRDKRLKDEVFRVSPAWNINILAEIATKTALKDEKYIKKSLEFIHNERKYLYNELVKIDEIKVYKPSVNFILFKINDDFNLREELLNKGILIRDCSNYRGLKKGFYRVAVRTHEENEKLIHELKDLFKRRKEDE